MSFVEIYRHDLIPEEIPVMSKVFLPYTAEDRIHNASLDFYTFHLHLKKASELRFSLYMQY